MEPVVESVPENARSEPGALWPRVLRAAALAVLLGLALEVLLLVLASGLGRFPGWIVAAADTVQRVAWSSLVCVALACGATAAAQRPYVLGALGLFSAPLAWTIARAGHKAALSALGGPTASGGSPLTLAIVRAVEYALFGVLIGLLGRRARAGLKAHVIVGLAVGLVFAVGLIVAQRPPMAEVPLRVVNEVLFPAGCACVLYVSGAVARSSRSAR